MRRVAVVLACCSPCGDGGLHLATANDHDLPLKWRCDVAMGKQTTPDGANRSWFWSSVRNDHEVQWLLLRSECTRHDAYEPDAV